MMELNIHHQSCDHDGSYDANPPTPRVLGVRLGIRWGHKDRFGFRFRTQLTDLAWQA